MPFYKVPDVHSTCSLVSEPAAAAGGGGSSSGVAARSGEVAATKTSSGFCVDRPNSVSEDVDGSDRSCSSNLAEMTEADRDSELLRRDLEQKVQMMNRETEKKHRGGGKPDSVNYPDGMANGSQRNGRRTSSSVIQKELMMQEQREAELASTRQIIYQNCSPSPHPTAKSSTDDEDDEGQGQTRSSSVVFDSTDNKHRDDDISSRYAHPGESRIILEMKEHRQRETELRGRWKEMGLDVEEMSENDTPFNLPEPLPTGQKRVTVTKKEEKRAEEDICHPSNGTLNKNENSDNVGVKVRPFEDPERKLAYIPANETPIEREIRLSREREDALRQARGLLPLNGGDHQGRESKSVEISVTSSNESNHVNTDDPTVRVSMKKLASSRLQMELHKEKERELALKSQGAIHTISEERAGEPVKYVEVISKQLAEAQPPTPSKTLAANQTLEVKQMSSVAPSNGKSEPEKEPVAPNAKVRQSLGHCHSIEPVNELESVFDGRQKHQQLRPKSSSNPTAAERKILNELKELQLREEELKSQRMTNSHSTFEDLEDSSD